MEQDHARAHPMDDKNLFFLMLANFLLKDRVFEWLLKHIPNRLVYIYIEQETWVK